MKGEGYKWKCDFFFCENANEFQAFSWVDEFFFFFFLFLKNHLQKKIWWSWEEGDGRWRFTWSETRRDLTVEICRERRGERERERERAKTLWEWEREGWRYIKNLKSEREREKVAGLGLGDWVLGWVTQFWLGGESRVPSSKFEAKGKWDPARPLLFFALLC